ncbi:MAG: SusC/RagA family TonB-linked outer membrane protein [Bacteroidales bacterium]
MKKNRFFYECNFQILIKTFRVMRITVFILLASILQTFANDVYSQKTRLSLDFSKTKLVDALDKIEDLSEFYFLYNEKLVDTERRISISAENKKIDEILDELFEGTDINYKITYLKIILAPSFLSNNQQQRSISGKVTDSDGQPLPGVTVSEKGMTNGTVTNANGEYTLTNIPENATLVFSFVGMRTVETAVGNKLRINVTLIDEQIDLEEVVVTALGIERDEKTLGFSTTKVGGDEFQTNKSPNIAQDLVGKVAGLNAIGSANGPGSSVRVTIRGNTSLTADNQPLYVVDGVPINNTVIPGSDRSAYPDWGDGISSISSDDIEKMTVLKGATAAALYGSRAKNGAILITTKSGHGQKGLGIEINSNTTFDVPNFLYEFQKVYGPGQRGVRPATLVDAKEGGGQQHWGEKYDGEMTMQYDGVERPYVYVKDKTIREFYQTGVTSTNNVALSGGSDNSSFRVGYTYLDQDPIVSHAKLNKNQFTLNATQTMMDKLTATVNVRYVTESSQNRFVSWGNKGDFASNIVWLHATMPSEALSPGYDEDGNEFPLTGTDKNATNPYYARNKAKFDSDRNRLIGSVEVKYDFSEWLYAKGKVGQDSYQYENLWMFPSGSGYRPNGEIRINNIDAKERNYEGLIGFNKDLNENTSLSIIAGGNVMTSKTLSTTLTGKNFVYSNLYVLNNTVDREVSTGYSEFRTNSLFATAEVGFKDYLFINLTGRNDWFSTLNPANNSYFYPSIGASFVFSELLNLPRQFDFGNFRISYASVGGATNPYMLDLTYSLKDYTYNGKSLGIIDQSNMPDRNLRPLSIKELELGLNLKMFGNRLGIDMAVYQKKTFNDIAVENISITSGYSGKVVNVGEITNKGIELLLTGKPIQTRNFSWEISGNFSYNESLVNKISSTSSELKVMSDIYHIEGLPYSQIYGQYIVRDDNGNAIVDKDGLPIVSTDPKAFGSGIHPYIWGVSNNLRFKSFELYITIDGKEGAYILNDVKGDLYSRGLNPMSLAGRENGLVYPGVNEEGEPNTVLVSAERINNKELQKRLEDALDDFVEDAGFIKLRNISLSYNIPFKNVGFIKGARVSIIGQNLAFLKRRTESIDPESNARANNAQGKAISYIPPTKSYGFNLNFKF